MSTTEQPDTPPLTRRRIREIQSTGATPIVGVSPASASDVDEDTFVVSSSASKASPDAAAAVPVAPIPKAALPVVVAPAPVPDASVDLGVSPLTRRQARQQERIRTASVPVITPDLAAQFSSGGAIPDTVFPGTTDLVRTPTPDAASATGHTENPVLVLETVDEPAEALTEDKPVVAAGFGAELLSAGPSKAELPPTFDQLIARDTSSAGSVATANALILSQTPSVGPLTGPVAATGEVLITGTFDLPEGLGSTGHAPGVADGHEADAVLVDGELPAHSSPTPIAASAAISTVKTDGEIIRPPAPEKGSRLMLTLAITAGALALALVAVLVVAIVTGVFS